MRGLLWRRLTAAVVSPVRVQRLASGVKGFESCNVEHVSLRYTILGSLSTAPSSGYDLARQFGLGLGWFWSASHSQIYPELKRLEEAGLIAGSLTTVGEKLEKRIYSITDEGLKALVSWVTGGPDYRPNRDPERIQLIFSDLASVAVVKRHLRAHLDHYVQLRDRVRAVREAISAGSHERVQKRLEGRSPRQQELTILLREFAYDGDVERAELEIAWAQRALRALDEYERRYGDDVEPAMDAASARVARA
ncbi:helix-turn-helix transcriptional regulator [Streptomyces sp. NPDC013157]|uniref:helix-turn-helix transcriptional regulator n=1 Tax=unclassified Streptomyces TaxID=2593676 RepID=UPI0036CA6C54